MDAVQSCKVASNYIPHGVIQMHGISAGPLQGTFPALLALRAAEVISFIFVGRLRT